MALYRARFPHELKTSTGKHVTFGSFQRRITRASFWQVCHGHKVVGCRGTGGIPRETGGGWTKYKASG